MKKITKWILLSVVIIIGALAAKEGIKYYLQGPKMPFNAILIKGNSENINKAKAAYKDNTKYTKDYKYKFVTQEVSNVVDGKNKVYTQNYVIMTKDTAKAMIKDQVFRVRRGKAEQTGSLNTELLTSIPNIDDKESIILQGDFYKTIPKLNIKGIDVPIRAGERSWMGYYPTAGGEIIITDDKTYKAIEGSEANLSLIRFAKGNMDCRNNKDKEAVENKLSGIDENDINYTIIKD